MNRNPLLHEHLAGDQRQVRVTADRYGCGARNDSEKRACALYLWLLGPTTNQLGVACPCRS
jgi:hypothetical protein